MSFEKYNTCPLAQSGFSLVHFIELGTRAIGPDGMCCCTASSYCPDVDKRDGYRCTLEHLKKIDSEAVSRRYLQSGED